MKKIINKKIDNKYKIPEEYLFIYPLIDFIEKKSEFYNIPPSKICSEILQFYDFDSVSALIRARYLIKYNLMQGKNYLFVQECHKLNIYLNSFLNKITKIFY